ncbi:MAG: EamA/RhaT family transporter, partial [Lactobacillus delbrueckii]
FEPLASMIGSIIVFHFQPKMMDYAASVMIIFAVLALNWTPRSKIKARVEK